jgi:hypothetical protein
MGELVVMLLICPIEILTKILSIFAFRTLKPMSRNREISGFQMDSFKSYN